MGTQVENWEEEFGREIFEWWAEDHGILRDDYDNIFEDTFIYELATEIEELPHFELVERVGGEDQGSYAHTIFKWKDTYYKMVYQYYSHMGYNLDYIEFYIVEPKQKIITVYE